MTYEDEVLKGEGAEEGTQEPAVERSLVPVTLVTSRIHYFPVVPKDNVRKERLIFSQVQGMLHHGRKDRVAAGEWGSWSHCIHGGGWGRGSRVPLSSLHSVQHLSPGNGAIHI